MSAATYSENRFHGWRVVAAAFVLAMFGWGLGFYGPPIYLQSVREARGWSLPLVSAAVTVHFLVGALVVANLPRLYRRFGVPTITKAGVIAMTLGVCGWAYATAPWQLFAATLLSGAGWVGLGAAAINAIVAPWFVQGRPAALGMAYNGASIGGMVFSPVLVAAIGALGFGPATMVLGGIAVVTVWFMADAYFARTPEEMGLKPDGGIAAPTAAALRKADICPLPGKALWRDLRFLTLAIGVAIGLFAQIGLIAHLYSLLVPAIGAQMAGWAMSLAAGCAVAGRTLVGWLMPPSADRRLIAMTSYGVQIAGSLAFLYAAGTSLPLLFVGVVLFGSGIGNATSLPPLIAQVEFAKEDSGRAVALVVAISQAAYAFAPAAFGAIRAFTDVAHTGAFFIVAAALQALAIVCFLLGKRFAA